MYPRKASSSASGTVRTAATGPQQDPCGPLAAAEPRQALRNAGHDHPAAGCVPADPVVNRNPEGEDQNARCRPQPAKPPVHPPVLAAVGVEDGKGCGQAKRVQPFKAVRGRLGQQSRGKDCKPWQKIHGGGIGRSQRVAADLRGRGWDRAQSGAGLSKPGDVVDREQEAQRHATEQNPPGLGVEAAQRHRRIAGTANCDEYCKSHQVHQPTQEKRGRHQQQRPAKPQLAARVKQPAHRQAQHQGHPSIPEHWSAMTTGNAFVPTIKCAESRNTSG